MHGALPAWRAQQARHTVACGSSSSHAADKPLVHCLELSRRSVALACPGVLLSMHGRAWASEQNSDEGPSTSQAASALVDPPSGVDPDDLQMKRRPLRPLRPVPKVVLRPGQGKKDPPLQLSRIIKGCVQLDGQHKGDPRTDRTSGAAAIADFDRFDAAGITSIDTADIYGPSEAVIGQWLRLQPHRSDVQVVTKVTVMEEDVPRLSAELLEYRLRRSLAKLGTPYADLVLLHWEDWGARGPKRTSYVDAARWLEDLKGSGLTRGVGLTNFDVPHLLQVLDAGVTVDAHEVQFSVLDRRPQLFMQDLCVRRKIPLIAYGTMAGGLLADRWRGAPPSAARLDTLAKAKYGSQLREGGGWPWLQDMLQALHKVGTRHGVPGSSVALRWVLDQPGVAAAAVGARNAAHVRAAQTAFSFALTEDDHLELDAAYEGAARQPRSDVFQWERGGEW